MRTAGVTVALLLASAAGALAQTPTPAPAAAAADPTIADGARVSLEYTLTDAEGTVLDSSQGRSPLTYTHGDKQLIPGLDRALTGLHVGDTRKVTVVPADAYGDVDPQATKVIGVEPPPR